MTPIPNPPHEEADSKGLGLLAERVETIPARLAALGDEPAFSLGNRRRPGRVVATDLRNPDFVAYARAFGAFGVHCDRTTDFPRALKAAREAAGPGGVPALVHLVTSAEDIAPNRTISGLRAG
jgi:hypothetical protein